MDVSFIASYEFKLAALLCLAVVLMVGAWGVHGDRRDKGFEDDGQLAAWSYANAHRGESR